MNELEQRVARAIGKEQRIFVDEGPLGYDLRLARAALKAHAEHLAEQGKIIVDNPSAVKVYESYEDYCNG